MVSQSNDLVPPPVITAAAVNVQQDAVQSAGVWNCFPKSLSLVTRETDNYSVFVLCVCDIVDSTLHWPC